MSKVGLYKEMAKYYDLFYEAGVKATRRKDYRKESAFLDKLIRKHGNKGKKLLDVGCGTGAHLVFLKKKYDVTGLDFSKEMLAVARKKLKGTRLVQGDMKKFRLRNKYDSIICMFSSINYNITKNDFLRTFKNFYRHLNTGGVAIIEMFITEAFDPEGRFTFNLYEKGKLHAGRIGSSRRDRNMGTIYYVHLIKDGKNTTIGVGADKVGIYSSAQIKNMAKQAGFKAIKLDKTSKNVFKRSYMILKKP